MTNYYSSDHHFFHAKIIEYCNRPFKSIEEMNEVLIENWNSVVGVCDTVWYLGDFAFARPEKIDWILGRLNGIKHLIRGNHDKKINQLKGWVSIQANKEIEDGGIKLFLQHHPEREWYGMEGKTLHLHGHLHGRIVGSSQCLDVGVDAGWNFRPVTLENILSRMETLPRYNESDYRKLLGVAKPQ